MRPWPTFCGLLAMAGLLGCTPAPDTVTREAPQILRIEAMAGWDGRGTLGGLWAAHPAARSAGEARLRDPSSGTAIDLMLLPAPNGETKIQLSSEAAERLGMTAGQLRRVEIIALRPVKIVADHPPVTAPPMNQTPAALGASGAPSTPRPAPGTPHAPLDERPPIPPGAPRAVIVGAFAQEANAQAAAAQFPTLATRITPIRGARPLWQLRALPATSEDEARTLANVKAAGFADAYLSPHQGAAPGPAR